MNNLLTRPAPSRERVNIRNPFKRFTLYYVRVFVYKSATVTTATSAARWMPLLAITFLKPAICNRFLIFENRHRNGKSCVLVSGVV